MAEKKTKDIEETVETPVVSNKPTRKKYYIPLSPDPQEEDSVYVSVNGKNYRVKKGVEVTLPIEVIEVLENSFRENNRAFQIARQKQEEFLEDLKNVKFI